MKSKKEIIRYYKNKTNEKTTQFQKNRTGELID